MAHGTDPSHHLSDVPSIENFLDFLQTVPTCAPGSGCTSLIHRPTAPSISSSSTGPAPSDVFAYVGLGKGPKKTGLFENFRTDHADGEHGADAQEERLLNCNGKQRRSGGKRVNNGSNTAVACFAESESPSVQAEAAASAPSTSASPGSPLSSAGTLKPAPQEKMVKEVKPKAAPATLQERKQAIKRDIDFFNKHSPALVTKGQKMIKESEELRR